MIANIDDIARTLTKFSLNKRGDKIQPSAFSMRKSDKGYLSVREIKEGWESFVKEAYSEYQKQIILENPGIGMPPDMIGYAEINVAELEATTIEDSLDIHGDNLVINTSFVVEEIPDGNTEYHAGIKIKDGSKQIVVKDTEPLPQDAIVVDRAPGMMAKKKLVELSKLKFF